MFAGRAPASAVVILGPTGSGKTPLGETCAERGLAGRRCVHFDFGSCLRKLVERGQADSIVSSADIHFLRGVLETGALLEDRDFPLAQRILGSFLASQNIDPQSVVILNGMPRHVGQAEALTGLLHVEAVIVLQCSCATVYERIRSNAGGDRTDRHDDDQDAIARKLAIFQQRTAPLVNYYGAAGAHVFEISVTATMSAHQMWEEVRAALAG